MTKTRITLDNATDKELRLALIAVEKAKDHKVIPEHIVKALSTRYKIRCAYCETPILSRNRTQRYCSGVCRKRAHREENCTCQLCGEILSNMNELVTVTAKIKDNNHENRSIDLNTCVKCMRISRKYIAGNDGYRPRAFFMGHVADEYKLLDMPPHFSEKDLSEMSDDLTRVIEGKLHKRQLGMRIYLRMSKSQTLLRLRKFMRS